MLIAFRVDASSTIGSGHVMRCLTLANAWRALGARTVFITRAHLGHLQATIEALGHQVVLLAAATAHVRPTPTLPETSRDDTAIEQLAEPAHAAWLGVPWQLDAQDSRAALEVVGRPDWLIVDHYALDARWHAALRPWVDRLMVIDELGDRALDCDLLLDVRPDNPCAGLTPVRAPMPTQNLSATSVPAALHGGLMGNGVWPAGRTGAAGGAAAPPPRARLLRGPAFAPLQPAYAELHDRLPPREGPIHRVLVFFGGADQHGLTERAVVALLHARKQLDRPLVIDVVMPSDAARVAGMRTQLHGATDVYLHLGLPTLAPLLAQADWAIGASGTASWERLCLGVPTLVVNFADNQRPIAQALARDGLIDWLGDIASVSDAALAQAVLDRLQQPLSATLSKRCAERVDGRGTVRVLTAMRARADMPVRVRHAWPADGSLFDTDFLAGLRDVQRQRYLVMETIDGIAVGGVHARCEEQGIGNGTPGQTESAAKSVDRASSEAGWTMDAGVLPAYDVDGLAASFASHALAALRAELSGVLTLWPQSSHDHDAAEATSADFGQKASLSNDARPDHAGRRTRPAPLRIALCSDATSWINPALATLATGWAAEGHQVRWTHDAALLAEGELCFFLSYGRIVGADILARHRHNLVVHESALPQGRGWSPLTWQVLEGCRSIPITLFEATEAVDAGTIYLQDTIALEGHELVDELRGLQAAATLRLCRRFVRDREQVVAHGRAQQGSASSYPRRRPADSELSLQRSLGDQLALLRVADPHRYPAWFTAHGVRYQLSLTRITEPDIRHDA